jgi:hypothetical protein
MAETLCISGASHGECSMVYVGDLHVHALLGT